jgi:tetratricopeptide (TPR) repeat protein
MIPFLMLLVSPVWGATALEVTYGVIGRGMAPVESSGKIHGLMEEEDWENAAMLWEGLGRTEPEWSEQALVWRVICLAKAGQYPTARKLLASDSESSVLDEGRRKLLLAWLLGEMGQDREAIRMVSDHQEFATDQTGAIVLEMRGWTSLDRHRRADKIRGKALDEGYGDAWMWFETGMEYFWRGKEVEGLQYFERAIHGEHASPLHYQVLFKQLMERGELRPALRFALEGLQRFPASESLFDTFLVQVQPDPAMSVLEQMAAEPELGFAKAVLGIVLVSQNSYQEAIPHLESAISSGERRPDLYRALAQSHRKEGEPVAAWNSLYQGAVANPWDEQLWLEFLASSSEPFQKKEALNALDRIWASSQPVSKRLVSKAYEVARSVQAKDLALLWADRDVDLRRNSSEAIGRRAMALMSLGRDQEAFVAFELALNKDPTNSMLLNNLAWHLLRPNEGRSPEPERALKLARRAIKHSPRPVAAYYDTLAACLWETDSGKEAIEAQKTAVELAPDSEEMEVRLHNYEVSVAD